MQLNNEGLKNTAWWTDHAYRLPRFDRSAMAEKTMQEGSCAWKSSASARRVSSTTRAA